MSKIGDWLFLIYGRVKSSVLWPDYGKNLPVFWVFMGKILEVLVFNSWLLVLISWVLVFSSWVFMIFRKNVETTSLTESAIVWISKCPSRVSKWQGWLKSANVWVSKCPGPVSKCLISKCQSANVRSANGKSAHVPTPNISWPDLGLQSPSGSGPDPSKRVGRVSMANS